MASTTQPVDFSDLYTALMNAVRSDTSVTATTIQAKRYINTALQDMHIGHGERFPWAERKSVLVTHPVYSKEGGATDGGVSATIGSLQVVFTKDSGVTPLGAPDNNDYGQANVRAGGKLLITGGTEPYEMSGVDELLGKDIGFLKSIYIEATTGIEAAFIYYEDEYDLASDFLRPLDARRFASVPANIELIGRNLFKRRYPKDISRGIPRVGTIVDLSVGTPDVFSGLPTDTEPRRRLRLHPPPDAVYRIPYSYVTAFLATSSTGSQQESLDADSDEPIVPVQYRQTIVLHALWHWLRDRNDDPVRAQQVEAEYNRMLDRVTGAVEVGQNRPQLRPRLGPYKSRAARPWGSGGGRFDRGNFDSGGR